MEFSVRCFTCGSVIGDLYEKYLEGCKEKKPAEVLDALSVERFCCRRMFISHVDAIGTISKYSRK
ncbi:TPA: DNA-directed RNA polymerase subunit N [Candidatus Micrarchaeota archaeon]|nr:DNA-directed RNA polymerase subunit N [Candidatus Micrarchaeota archaeon]